MTEQNSSQKLSDFGLIDYQKPLGRQQDMRTSTYMGHQFVDDNMLGNKMHVNYKTIRNYNEDPLLEKHKTTNYRSNYVWKFGNPHEIRNVALNKEILYMKPFYECNLKFLTRPMRPAISVTHSDYLWQPESRTLAPVRDYIPSPVSHTKIVIDRNQPGFSKYLDPNTTTTNLDYCHRSPKDVMNSIAAKDNITFWNWKEHESRNKKVFRAKDAQLCDSLPSNECTKRRCEFPSTVKAVPHSGFITEVRENYGKPNDCAIIIDDSHIKNHLTFVHDEPTIGKTGYGIVGSGECTQNYV